MMGRVEVMRLASRKGTKFLVLETKADSLMNSALLQDDTCVFPRAKVFRLLSGWPIVDPTHLSEKP
ncbi:hypothetical protein SETIT_2G149200v2 [Setaria italica]|uniref:Uncharacterized protein n=2 Tax=Setaria TaxID=4554 RepID=A0A368PYT5_SETIT|nr:hypothetical protein SETIT_2G149200v2 [Setaria italica]TKW32220.1 hypothetical protein SEVIR_2G162700v2 [Setaria viridis]